MQRQSLGNGTADPSTLGGKDLGPAQDLYARIHATKHVISTVKGKESINTFSCIPWLSFLWVKKIIHLFNARRSYRFHSNPEETLRV